MIFPKHPFYSLLATLLIGCTSARQPTLRDMTPEQIAIHNANAMAIKKATGWTSLPSSSTSPPIQQQSPSPPQIYTQKPSLRRYASSYPGYNNWIKSVSDNGSIIVLDDGSVWQVDRLDQIDSRLWLRLSNITVVDDGFESKLINTDDNEVVGATRLR
jgi:hypothetical protein